MVRVNEGSVRPAATARLGWLGLGLLFAALAAAGQVHAQPGPPDTARGGGHGAMFGASADRVGRMVDRMLDGINATDAQRTQIKQIVGAAAADLKAQREAGRGLAQRRMQIFAAPNVDPAAAEQMRQQMLVQHDQASRRITQAMLDASRVLSPEQRAKIAERMQDRQARMQDRRNRMGGMGGMGRGDRPPR